MKLRLLSDLHEEFAARIGGSLVFDAVPADVTILAGDIGNGVGAVEVALRPCFANTTVILVPGNHEYYQGVMPEVIAAMRKRLQQANQQGQHHVHLLDNQTLQIGNVFFIGTTLWTDYALHGNLEEAQSQAKRWITDYRLIETAPGIKLTPAATVQMHWEARKWLEQTVRTKPAGAHCVVVSHHAPHPHSIAARFIGNSINPAFVSDLTSLMQGVDLWVHGHTHDGFDYVVNNTRVVANPAGYREKTGSGWAFENPTFDSVLQLNI